VNIKIPWILSRRRKIFAIIFDYLIGSTLYNLIYLSKFNNYPNKLVTTSFVCFWVIISYIIGRYIGATNFSFVSLSKTLIKTGLLFILCNFIYLLINWTYPLLFFWDSDDYYKLFEIRTLNNFFIRITIYISLASAIFQYIFSVLTHNIYDQKKEWIFYGEESKYKQILEEVSLNKKELNLIWLSNKDPLDVVYPEKIEGIIINDFNIISKENTEILFKLKLKGIAVESLLSWFEKKFHRIPSNIIHNKYQLLENLKSIDDNYQIRIKRIGDIVISLFLITITFPISLVVSILIYFEDKGPIFYCQKRTGLNGREINILKFRSMKVDAERDGIIWAKESDPRITKVGKVIRAIRLDELPQLLCVIKGDMSLIGPRPERPEIEDEILKSIPYYSFRNILKPGISGWAQVNYPYGASVYDTNKKLSYDIYYISHFSILLDLLIFFKTIKIVLNAKNYRPAKSKK